MILEPGVRLGHYEILEKIGEGGPAFVRKRFNAGEPWRGLADRLRLSGFVESRGSEAKAEANEGTR